MKNEMLEIAQRQTVSEQFFSAIQTCREILKKENSIEAKYLLYNNLQKIGQFDEAIAIATELATTAGGMSNLSSLYSAAGNISKAIDCAKKAIALQPNNSLLHTNYIILLNKLGYNCEEYIDNLLKELQDENIWYNYGIICEEKNNYKKAKDCYLKAISFRSVPIIHYNLSLVYFMLGDYNNGWKEYESRWQACWLFSDMRKRLRGKFWQGEDLKNKSILLWCEQGIGDLVHFYRYVKEIENLGAKIYMKYEDTLFGYKYNNQDYDYNCSILTAAGILKADINQSDGKSYLKSKVKEDIILNNKNKIGICWRGNIGHPRDEQRSIKLKEFDFLKGDIYSLVKEYSPAVYENGHTINWEEGTKNKVIDLSRYMISLDYTSKIIEEMNVVITVDTLIGHLAGALGKKTYLLLPYNCDWRWSLNFKDKTPWYKSVTIIRQKKKDDWSNVILQLKEYILKEGIINGH